MSAPRGGWIQSSPANWCPNCADRKGRRTPGQTWYPEHKPGIRLVECIGCGLTWESVVRADVAAAARVVASAQLGLVAG